MVQTRIYFDGSRVGEKFQRSIFRQADLVREGVRAAAVDAVAEIRERSAADIKAAGRFGKRWVDGIDATISEGGGNIRVDITHQVPYFDVFQSGRTIQGKPLLWIPLSFAKDAQGVSAKDYAKPLFRVDRKGGKAPLLMTPGKPATAVYFGKESVTIKKKFHVVEIIQEVARQMGDLYRARRAA